MDRQGEGWVGRVFIFELQSLYLQQSFLSGSERDQARSPESPSLLMMRMKARLTLLALVVLRRKRRRRRKKRRRNNLVLNIINIICFELLEFPNLRNIHRLQIELEILL